MFLFNKKYYKWKILQQDLDIVGKRGHNTYRDIL